MQNNNRAYGDNSAADTTEATEGRTADTMAMSNLDRIGRVIQLLPDGLLPLVEREMTRRQGSTWFDDAVAEEREKGRGLTSKRDPQFLLNIVQRYWGSYFRHSLPGATRGYASEVNDVRNRWAHNEPFSADDTVRALDTAERLLVAVGATAELVEQIRKSRLDLQRTMIEAETKRHTKRAAAMPSVAADGLKPWRDVLVPHQDVARGDFNASEFAANLAQVAKGEGAPEYTEPEEFFQRTYLTDGLRDLLSKSLRRVSGDNNASPTVNLQTNFGGGKTHSMLALYHLYAPGLQPQRLPQEMQELIAASPSGLPKEEVRRAVLVGTALAPGQPDVKPDGTTINTLWGELAWQLGGQQAYDILAEADQSRTSPGSELLQDLLASYAPCLILIDEWVVYARQLVSNDDLPAGTFETHFGFAQSLTEAVEAVTGAQLVLSIPASEDGQNARADTDEIGGEAGQIALDRLQKVIHRKADSWRPASSDESFEIVRRRLFETPTGAVQAEINKAARLFSQFYATYKRDFPAGVDRTDYEQRIKSTYPIHPELFTRLYEDWSTLDRFQRTRGVLRLMSAVIHALWRDQNKSPMIMPGDIPLDDQRVASELTHYLEDRWKPIIDADVDGPDSTPVAVDNEKTVLGQRAMSRRVARTVFMGSAPTIKAAKKGLSEAHIRLGMAIPGDAMGNFRTALNTLADRSTYLYGDADRYWFDTHANITRRAKDEAERLIGRDEDVWAEIVRRLSPIQHRRGDFGAVHIAPQHTKDVPDLEQARLVLLHPKYVHRGGKDVPETPALQFSVETLSSHGTKNRNHQNTLVFLAPDKKDMGDLMEAAREYLGWKKVLDIQLELDLTESQRRQAQTRRDQANEKIELRIGEAYRWALVPEQSSGGPIVWEHLKVDGGRAGDAAVRTADRLRREGLLYIQQAPALLYQKLSGPLSRLWEQGHISVGELWKLHTTYPYMNRLVNRLILDQGIEDVLSMVTWETEGFALASGYDEQSGRYQGLTLPSGNSKFGQITDSTILVRVDQAVRQQQKDEEAAAQQRASATTTPSSTPVPAASGTTNGTTARTPGSSQQPVIPQTPTRFYANAQLTSEQYSKNATKYFFEILQHLDAIGAEVEITVEIQARNPDGFSEDKVRILTENANTLKLNAEFEVE
ncbi:DUF499 domain-containing protein [Streptomyces scabiei]|uniref:DUF499 domain-containing protein n=1 Tax=Streptomyces scabiei TaxID=1930 RepID=UPI000AC5F52B|nr:DUF499 domain-containing protein [Streptomyces scabiei]MDX2833918.1 DUF499 domain-containing protein [Streptomyces scabiei]MDX3678285.1 DUF499 domain-containing protein [Streptomyces scabiei]